MLNPIFKFLIPVFSFSSASNCTSQFFPSICAVFNLSISSSYPSFIIPPSFTVIGGSSTIDFSIKAYTSCNSSNFSYKSFNKSDLHSFNISFTAGSLYKEFFSVIISLAFAFPYAILPVSLSISYTFFKFSIMSPLKMILSFNSFTAFNLLFISCTSTNGSFSHLLSNLPPIDVDVLSSTQSKVPFLDLSLIFSVISRFLLAFISKAIYFESLYTVILLIWSKLVFWVSSMYSIKAFIELTTSVLSAKSSTFLPLLSTMLNLKFILFNSLVKNLS